MEVDPAFAAKAIAAYPELIAAIRKCGDIYPASDKEEQIIILCERLLTKLGETSQCPPANPPL